MGESGFTALAVNPHSPSRQGGMALPSLWDKTLQAETHAIGSVPACTAAVKQQRLSALFDELSGAEEEEESPREGLRVKGRGKRPLPEEENEDAGATEKNASRMSTKSLDKMIRLLKSMAQDGADNTFESSSDDGELGGESAAESDVEDMFKVEALPLTTRG